MDQYIHDNTEDEFTHLTFINAYLVSKGATPVNLEPFRTLPGSQATGADKTKKRLTNLMQLTVDTSWWTRYRSRDDNPDLEPPNFMFPQAVPGLFKGQFPAIPRTMPTSLLRTTSRPSPTRRRSISPRSSKAAPASIRRWRSGSPIRRSCGSCSASARPRRCTSRPGTTRRATRLPSDRPDEWLVFPDLNAPPFGGALFQTNLIMPEPCPFISRKFPRCSIIRPT